MSTKQIQTSGGSLFPTLLTILFVYLKLTHQIDWSWWWVLSPLWISLALAIFFILIAVLLIAVIKR